MRTALLIGFNHGGETPRIIDHGNPSECNVAFKKLQLAPGKLRELQLWESGAGVTKRKRFEAPKKATAEQAAAEKAAAEKAEAEKAEAEKAEADKAK